MSPFSTFAQFGLVGTNQLNFAALANGASCGFDALMLTSVVVLGMFPASAINRSALLPVNSLSQSAARDAFLLEAAAIDGARPFAVFREVTLPLLKPIFVILTSLSIIWDFQVFNQIWIMLDQRPNPDYFLMSVYAYVESFRIGEYGLGSAIAVVMVVILFAATLVYIRQMVKTGEVT